MGPAGEILSGSRLRKDGTNTDTPAPFVSNTPTTFRLATEQMLGDSAADHGSSGVCNDSTYGVQSLQDTICVSPQDATTTERVVQDDDEEADDGQASRRRSTLRAARPLGNKAAEAFEQAPDGHTASLSQYMPSPPQSMSHSLTSLSLDSQAPLSSLPSSPKSYSNRSLRPSDEESMDEAGSQAVVPSSEDDSEPQEDVQDRALQLIMPSITMPRRRPFTERGKNMGRLKVLIAGETGVGKTSLIKSIIQTCDDIVHVDSSPASVNQLRPWRSNYNRALSKANSTQRITEIYASTKAYPPWWSDLEETTVSRRRRASGDTVLERNICFVDTPGYSQGMSRMESIDSVVQYIEAQLYTSLKPTLFTGDSVGLLSGNGGCQVDVALYLVKEELKQEDIVFIQRLAEITNVIPLIAKSDTLSPEEVETARGSIADRLRHSELRCFNLNSEFLGLPPYTICSAPYDDCENMDASLLMSSDYIQPLITSQLATLIQKLFDKEVTPRLRHVAALKLVQAQRESAVAPSMPKFLSSEPNAFHSRPLTTPIATGQARNKLQTTYYSAGFVSPNVQTRTADHTQREEKLAQIRLAKWASDLQQSLQNERARYEAIARDDRARWLTERLRESSHNEQHSQNSGSRHDRQSEKRFAGSKERLPHNSHSMMDNGDPLGLSRWNEIMRRRGWFAIQMVGGFGVIGALTIWTVRNWSSGSDCYWSWTWWER